MKIFNFYACCAAYCISSLDYIHPANSWYQENHKELFPQLVEGYQSGSPTNGFMAANLEDPSAHSMDIICREDQLAAYIKRTKKADIKASNIKRFMFIRAPRPPYTKQYYLASRMKQWEGRNGRFGSDAKFSEAYGKALHQEMQDQLGFYFKNGYMLYAITNSGNQPGAEYALDHMGFARISDVISRNSTRLVTWYINTADLGKRELTDLLGADRMKDKWESGQMKAALEYGRYINDWILAIEMNDNPEWFDENGNYLDSTAEEELGDYDDDEDF